MEQNRYENRDLAISVDNVKKSFRVYYDKGRALKERLLFWNRNKYENHVVLRGVSFQIRRGEAIGIVGQNGCGKSTILKLMTRIMYPDSGSILVDGRVSALIELGAGFHPDMSGRENIYTNAAIFGLSHREVSERLQAIIDFSELGDYIDNPVRTYSSGMYMRLAFSVAINVDADILFIDEILAVGDAAFQQKCFNKLREIKEKGTTIVIVSHSLGQIEQLCERSIWIKDGVIAMDGPPCDVHAAYMEYMGNKAKANAAVSEPPKCSRECVIREMEIKNDAGEPCSVFPAGSTIWVELAYEAVNALKGLNVQLDFYQKGGALFYGSSTALDRIEPKCEKGRYRCRFALECCPFPPGEYTVDAALSDPEGQLYDLQKNLGEIRIRSDVELHGRVYAPHSWKTLDE